VKTDLQFSRGRYSLFPNVPNSFELSTKTATGKPARAAPPRAEQLGSKMVAGR
jgi:hypothetical protein